MASGKKNLQDDASVKTQCVVYEFKSKTCIVQLEWGTAVQGTIQKSTRMNLPTMRHPRGGVVVFLRIRVTGLQRSNMLTAQSLKTKYVVSRSARAGPSRCRQGELLPFRLFKSHGTSPGNWGHVFTSAGRTWSEHRIRAAPSVGHSKTCVDDGESDSNQTPRDSNPQPLDNERISPARVRRSPTRYPLRQASTLIAGRCMLDKANILESIFSMSPLVDLSPAHCCRVAAAISRCLPFDSLPVTVVHVAMHTEHTKVQRLDF